MQRTSPTAGGGDKINIWCMIRKIGTDGGRLEKCLVVYNRDRKLAEWVQYFDFITFR